MAIDLTVRSDERAFIAGRTGSGKTFFCRYLTASSRRLVVLDPKGMLTRAIDPAWKLDEWSEKGRKALLEGDPCRLRVGYPDDGDWEPYLADTFKAGNVLIYVDEMYGVVPPGKQAPKSLTAAWTRGRQLGVGVVSATQRPAWVPLFAMSEADWFFIFRLTLEEDRRRLASFMGQSVMEPIRDRYGFLTYNAQWDGPVYTPRLVVRKVRSNAGVQ